MDIFTTIERRIEIKHLTVDDERSLVVLAQGGDKTATEQLIRNYIPLMKKTIQQVAAFAVASHQRVVVESDEWQSAAIIGFYDALEIYDARRHERLAQVIGIHLRNAIQDTRLSGMLMAVPREMRGRFSRTLTAAGGDPTRARDLAPQFGLAPDTFSAIAQAYTVGNYAVPGAENANATEQQRDYAYSSDNPSGYRAVADLDGARMLGTADVTVRLDDLRDAHRALDSLDDETRLIIECLFGLGDQPAMSEREASAVLGIPRTTLQRKAARALDAMRATLGA